VKQEKQEQNLDCDTYEIRIQKNFIAKDKQNKALRKKRTQNWWNILKVIKNSTSIYTH
jgi:uncharacterized protein (DUF927 family)